jgi:g-D-glutamyl-meso-diaminopimelate peptidase
MEATELIPADYAYVSGQVCEITRQCPFVKSHVIGKSLVGRNIYAMDFGYSQNKVLYAAAFHGTEWITSLLLLRFAQNLCRAVEKCDTLGGINAVDALKQSALCIVPCVNPDGVEIAIHGASAAAAYSPLVLQTSKGDTSTWQANARGVDLNHNFDAGWCALK